MSGTFAGYANGDPVGSYDGRQWRIYYGANAASGQLSGGNDVLLAAAAPVPEPSCLALLGVSAVLLLSRSLARAARRVPRAACQPVFPSKPRAALAGKQPVAPGGPGFEELPPRHLGHGRESAAVLG